MLTIFELFRFNVFYDNLFMFVIIKPRRGDAERRMDETMLLLVIRSH